MKEPFNITLGGVIWKVASSELADLIEDSADPTSENYLKISASWELGFTDYNLVILPEDEKNIDMERVKAVTKLACIDDYIENHLPNKYETEVGENSIKKCYLI